MTRFWILYLVCVLCDGKSVTWIDLSDVNEIYAEVGLTGSPVNYYNPETNDHCTVKLNVNDTVRVTCQTVTKCQISSLNSTSLSNVISTSSAGELWKRCEYREGGKLFGKVPQLLGKLDSTVAQLLFGGNGVSAFPRQYFCGLRNLTSLDLSRNDLSDISEMGLETDCSSANDETCCGCQLKELILNKNRFEVLKDDAFCSLAKTLLVLRLADCRLHTISTFTFRGLDRLKYLDLIGNNLTSLADNVFFSNGELYVLYLSQNRLNGASLTALKHLRSIRQLHLDRNQIATIDPLIFKSLYRLKLLNLRENLLTALEVNIFQNTFRLQLIDLSFNRLENVNASLFLGLSSLSSLDLSNNQLQVVEDGSFRDCTNLKYLMLGNNLLEHFPRSCNGLPNLKHLYVDRNRITALSSASFDNLTTLVELDLSHNNISKLENGIFNNFRKLVTLKLTGNRLTDVHRQFTDANIVNLILDYNRLKTFSFADFSPKVKILSVVGNRISSFNSTDDSSSMADWNMQELDISCNLLVSLDNIYLPPKLQKLNARRNKLTTISYDPKFMKLGEFLRTVNLQQNEFQEICKTFVGAIQSVSLKQYFAENPLKCSCENVWLKQQPPSSIDDFFSLTCTPTLTRGTSSSPVRIQNLTEESFLCKSDPQNWACRCDSGRNCSIDCPDNCTCYTDFNKNIAYVDCGNSGLSWVPQTVDYRWITRNSVLYMDGNDIAQLNKTSFESFSNLIDLFLNDSNVVSIDVDAFDDLRVLKSLHLQDNKLRTLPPGVFQNLDKLRELYLQNNLLNILPDNIFTPLDSLIVLNLAQNRLVSYGVWNLDELKTLRELDLRNNSWSCNCTFIDKFRKFIQNVSATVKIMPDQLFCREANGSASPRSIVDYHLSKCIAATTLNSFTPTITYIWASLLAVFVLLTFVSLLVFYFRHEMQVMIYSHYGIRIFQRNESRSAEDEGKLYDAFIAYSSDDEEFLVYSLLPGLEQIERPYRLCLHQRDFAPGAFITDSILEAIEKSSRTIILLSENFVKSEWCKFEFKTAHIQMLHDRCARVLMVVLGDIPAGVDSEMKLYLKTNTYLKWGEKLFWEKLYFALPDKTADQDKETFEMINRDD